MRIYRRAHTLISCQSRRLDDVRLPRMPSLLLSLLLLLPLPLLLLQLLLLLS